MGPFDWVGVVAILIAILSLLISLNSHLRDRSKLMFEGSLITMIGSTTSYQLRIRVSNIGRRPISINEIRYESQVLEHREHGISNIWSQILGGAPPKFSSVELAENQTRQFVSREHTIREMLDMASEIKVEIVDSRARTHDLLLNNDAKALTEEELRIVEEG